MMTQLKAGHTSWPWGKGHNHRRGREVESRPPGAAFAVVVATIHPGREEAEANAQLVACSPDLYLLTIAQSRGWRLVMKSSHGGGSWELTAPRHLREKLGRSEWAISGLPYPRLTEEAHAALGLGGGA
jgi:hypothetical protein